MTAENQLISWTLKPGFSLPHMSEGKQLSKTNKHLIKQNIKLELLLTCTPRLGVLTPLYRKGQTPSNGLLERHQRMCGGYEENIMSDADVCLWCRKPKI
ncbi:hypothetical protein J6590_103292 [Homalodisca vitripennis]|nr:hypothetical protein J6590_103292 [Homalodisca vitripennis]